MEMHRKFKLVKAEFIRMAIQNALQYDFAHTSHSDQREKLGRVDIAVIAWRYVYRY
jgi:hypothetical protein